MTRLYLVRHGVTIWNAEGRWQGHTDTPLSDEGIAQAERIARRLASERLDAIWSSDLQRAHVTARAIATHHGLEVTTTPLIREQMLGDWEGLTAAEIEARGEADLLAAYRRDGTAHRPPNSEPLTAVRTRLLEAVQMIRRHHPDGSVVLVGHGGSLRFVLSDALDGALGCWRRITLANASLSLIAYDDERTRVHFVNDTCHLAGLEGDRR